MKLYCVLKLKHYRRE